MPPTNLDQFYRQQGQVLPSVVDRAKVFEQQGLGPLQTYQGTAEQNSALLNKLIAGTAAPMKPPTGVGVVVSSEQARNQFNQNVNTLPRLESEFMPKTGQVGDVAIKKGAEVKSGVGGETPLPEPQGAITIKSNNPAFQSIIDQTNEMIRKAKESGLALPPSAGDLIRQIQDYSLTKAAAVADAREAADEKNAAKLNESLAKVKEAETTQKSAIQTLLEELRTARVGMTEALAPTARETELKRNLQELRTNRQLLPLELRKEGISAGGIQSRQGEDERVRAIQESNLLFELGLEQEARQMKGAAFEKQAGFIKDDINLQMKIEENLKAEEAKIVEQAQTLRKDAVTALSDIVDSFEGLAFTDMDAETQTQLLETAKDFGIPSGLLTSALANAKKQKVFENSLKVGKNTSSGVASSTPMGILDVQRYNELYPDAGIVAGDSEATANAKVAAMGTRETTTPEKISLPAKDAQKLNKELVTNDAYKAIRKGQDSLQFLKDFEDAFSTYGLETLPGKGKAKLQTTYQTTLLNLKEFFNLGVLNGPDLEVLKGIIPDPTTGAFKKFRGRSSAVSEGIKNIKTNIEKTLDDRYQSLATQYGQYSIDDLSALKDAQRIYVEQKSSLNPSIKKLVDENKGLSPEEIIQIIQP